jgi:GR25 family glycosyltransferase involved in LPS biosynthesis
MQIENIPIYYISFKRKIDLEQHLYNNGFNIINWYPAVNGKELSIDYLVEDKVISYRSFADIIKGRSIIQGLSSMGAVGCYLSHAGIYKEILDNNIPYAIICEDDVHIKKKNINFKSLNQSLNNLYQNYPASVCTFGHSINAGFLMRTFLPKFRKKISDFDNNIDELKQFYGLHMYMVSFDFCKNVQDHLFPIEVQIDSVFPLIQGIKLFGTRDEIAIQIFHKSSIQTDVFKNLGVFLPKSGLFYIMFLSIVIYILFQTFKYKKLYKRCTNQK